MSRLTFIIPYLEEKMTTFAPNFVTGNKNGNKPHIYNA